MILRNIFVYPKFPQNLHKLYELTHNLWFTWNYDAINLFYRIDGQLFRQVDHNPIQFVHALSKERVEALSRDRGFLFELEKVWQKYTEYMKYVATFRGQNGSESEFGANDIVAYFSMEFGLHECLPIYAGGLGILAGDYLKSASDMGLPIVGVGLLYKYGYFTQRVTGGGEQEEVFADYEKHLAPIRMLRSADGGAATVSVRLPDGEVKARVWQVDVGATRCLLLDTDLPENPPQLRHISDELYVADRQERIQQEIILGLGGLKALALAGIQPRLYHLNEGHSAFLIIGRLQELMKGRGLSFAEARAMIRASTVFTTHTPVAEGNEHFSTEMVRPYLEPEAQQLGLTFEQLASFGFVEARSDVFWLPAFAIRFAGGVNGVSRAHMRVSRRMWAGLFPELPSGEVPIDYVTNGVHISWVSEVFTGIFERYVGPDYIRYAEGETIWARILDVPDEEIWEAHRRNKKDLVAFIRRRLTDYSAARGFSQAKFARISRVLNPDYLTVVFARRFAHYKRATLLLRDKDRLAAILSDSEKPVQVIFAGKAHPADERGKNMIKEIFEFAKERHLEDRVLFLENYDMNIARHLVWGADVWLNTPGKDMEASGTSGMKAAMNGVLHLSGLEGWWAEGYNGRNGWAITAGQFYRNPEMQDVAEASQIYDLLETEISEAFYRRNEAGVPDQWVQMMKESIASVCQDFNMNRALATYLKKFYMSAKRNCERICSGEFQLLKEASRQESEVLQRWPGIAIASFATDMDAHEHVVEGQQIHAECGVRLGDAPAGIFKVELFYQYDGDQAHEVLPMTPAENKDGVSYYRCEFAIKGSGLQQVNARIRPANEIVQDMHPEWIKWKD